MARKPEAKRNSSLAHRIAKEAYPYSGGAGGCCLCGQTVGVDLAHLDHDAANNEADNLAYLCRQHHWLFDIGLFSLKALKLQRAHWERLKGKPTNIFMGDAGIRALETRRKHEAELRRRARKAARTRRARAESEKGGA